MILEANDFRNQHHINTTLRSKYRLHSGHAWKGYELNTLYEIRFGKSIESYSDRGAIFPYAAFLERLAEID